MSNKEVFIKAKETANGIVAKFRIEDKYILKIINFRNYFFIKEEDILDDETAWNYCKSEAFSGVNISTPNGVFVKLYLKNNFWRNKFRQKLENNFGISVFEGDINAVKHWLIENQEMKLNAQDLRITYFDIETDDRGEFCKEEDGTVIAKGPVMSCAIRDNKNPTEFLINENVDDIEEEKKFLIKLFEKLKHTDVLTAWNGKKFDYPYLEQRGEFHELFGSYGEGGHIDFRLINKFDEMIKIKKVRDYDFKSFALNSVAKQVLGEGKIDFSDAVEGGNGNFYRLWATNKKLFEEYNRKDVDLMFDIEKKFKDMLIHLTCSDLCHCPIEDTMFNSMMSDYLMLNKYKDRNLIAPSKPNEAEILRRKAKGGISGGYTFCFTPGLHQGVLVFDYKSHYPLLIMTFNICTSTYVSTEEVDWNELSEIMGWTNVKYMLHAHKMSNTCKNKNNKYNDRDWRKAMKQYCEDNQLSEEYLKFDTKLEELMWHMLDKYVGHKYSDYVKENKLIYSPADFNKDTNGWHFHFHRLFTREIGVVPEIQDFVLENRDKIKYEIKTKLAEDFNFKNTFEFSSLNGNQCGIKTVGNALFGFLGFLKSRFYKYDVADTITTGGRWIIKKSIIFAKKNGFEVTSGDTDSIFVKNINFNGTYNDMNKLYYEYYKTLFKPFNCNMTKEVVVPQTELEIINKEPVKKETLPYYCVFEWEHTYKAIIIVAKKRYYFLETGTDKEGKEVLGLNTMGGAFKTRDTNPLAAKLQKELCFDVLTNAYDRNKWIKILTELKVKVFDYRLEIEYLTYSKNYSKHYNTYGKPMLDGNTGIQKTGSDGKPRFASIPAHIKMITRLDSENNLDYDVGDVIEYIIAKPKVVDFSCSLRTKKDRKKFKKYYDKFKAENPVFDITRLEEYLIRNWVDFKPILASSQEAITVKEYKAGAKYSTDDYFSRIIGPIIEILNVIDKKAINKEYINCWDLTDKQIERINKDTIEK